MSNPGETDVADIPPDGLSTAPFWDCRKALQVGAVVLVFAEVLWLTSRIDGIVLLARVPGLYRFVGAALAIWQTFAVFVVTMAILSLRTRAGIAREVSEFGRPRSVWVPLIFHVAVLVAFAWANDRIFGPGSRALPTVGLIAWGFLGLATLASALAIAWPIEGWAGWGRRNTGRLAFAALAGLLAFASGRLTLDLWRPLNRATFWLAAGMLRLISPEIVCRRGDWEIGTPKFSVIVESACSGYEGIGLIIALIGAYLLAFRHDLRMPRALLLLPIGVFTIWVANAVRIVGLIAIGTWGSSTIALTGFHSQAGWIAFNAIGLGLIAVSRVVPWFRSGTAEPLDFSASPTVAYLAPMILLTATAMITGAFSSGFDLLYPARIFVAGITLWSFRNQYSDIRATWSWGSVAIGAAMALAWAAFEIVSGGHSGSAAVPARLAVLPRGLAATWLTARVLGYVVVAPLVEELAFRGYLIRRLSSSDFSAIPAGRFGFWTALISSILFGLMHDRVVAGTLAGLAYAYALRRRGELTDAVIAHATTNAFLALLVLTTGDWSYWG